MVVVTLVCLWLLELGCNQTSTPQTARQEPELKPGGQ